MRRFDDHPDELLDRERQGSLRPGEAEELESHRAVCAACALEASLPAATALAIHPGDDALLSRLVDRAVDGAGAGATAAGAGGLGKLLAVTVAVAGGALLAWLVASSPAAPPRRAATAAIPPTSTATDTAEPAEVAPTPAARPTEPAPETPTAPPPAATPRRAASEKLPERTASPAELFRQANEARRAGRVGEAAELYRRLETEHAASDEAIASHVALGRLLLDRLGDPAGARARFERYLAARPDGTLAEESRLGRALALGRLGARDGERAAWEELLARHPSSVHADRARTRLHDLDARQEGEETP